MGGVIAKEEGERLFRNINWLIESLPSRREGSANLGQGGLKRVLFLLWARRCLHCLHFIHMGKPRCVLVCTLGKRIDDLPCFGTPDIGSTSAAKHVHVQANLVCVSPTIFYSGSQKKRKPDFMAGIFYHNNFPWWDKHDLCEKLFFSSFICLLFTIHLRLN